MKQAG